MLTLEAGQAALVARAAAAPILLVHLETFTNYASDTVDTDFYWTLGVGPIRYPWGLAVDFDPVIQQVSPVNRTMDHIPDAADFPQRSKTIELLVGNLDDGAGPLWQTLRAENLEFARVTIAILLVETARRTDRSSSAWFDFTDYAGTEHTVVFRGELSEVSDVTENGIPITFKSIEPELDWPMATVATEVDPKDLGKRYPISLGKSKGVACINRTVGWVTTLAEPITDTTTGVVAVSDTTGLPASPTAFTLQLGSERVTATTSSATAINISARGVSSSIAAAHQAGTTAIEILTSSKIVYDGNGGAALAALYVVSPVTGEKTLISSANYSVNDSDTALDTGRTLGVVTISAASMRAIFDDLAAATAITAQPTFESGALDTLQIPFTSAVEETGTAFTPDATAALPDDSLINLFGPPFDGQLYGKLENNPGSTQGFHFWIGNAPSGGRAVSRFRVVWLSHHGEHATRAFELIVNFRFYGEVGSQTFATATGSAINVGVINKSAWETPTAKIVSDIERVAAPTVETNDNYLSFYVNNPSTDADESAFFATIMADQSFVEVELEPENLTRTADVSVSGPSTAVGLIFIADVIGIGAVGGAHILAIVDPLIGQIGVPAAECDTAAEWSVVTGTGSISDDAVTHVDGSAVRFDFTSGAQFGCESTGWATPIDLTGKLVRMRLRTNNSDAGVDGLSIGIADSGGLTITAKTLVSTIDFDEDTWYTLILDPTVGAGTGDITDWAEIAFLYGNGIPAGLQIWLDEIEVVTGLDGAPVDAIQWLIEDFAGLAGALESVSAAETETNLGDNAIAGDLRLMGENFPQLLSSMGYEARTNIVLRESSSLTEYRLLSALADYGFLARSAFGIVDPLAAESGDQLSVLDDASAWSFVQGVGTETDDAVIETDGSSVRIQATDVSPGFGTVIFAGVLDDPVDTVGKVLRFHFRTDQSDPANFTASLRDEDGVEFARARLSDYLDAAGTLQGYDVSDAFPLAADTWYVANINPTRSPEGIGDPTKLLTIRLTASGPAVDNDQWWIDDFELVTVAPVIDQARDWTESRKAFIELATRFSGLYGLQPWEGDGVSAFKEIVRIGSDVNDLTPLLDTEIDDAELLRGLRVAASSKFKSIQLQASAADVLGYYAYESLRQAARFGFTVPWSEGFTLELGDIVYVRPPWWTSWVPCRIIGTSLMIAETRVGLNVEEIS